jgi:hypothetical protein
MPGYSGTSKEQADLRSTPILHITMDWQAGGTRFSCICPAYRHAAAPKSVPPRKPLKNQ